jgi:hypothetical protein
MADTDAESPVNMLNRRFSWFDRVELASMSLSREYSVDI